MFDSFFFDPSAVVFVGVSNNRQFDATRAQTSESFNCVGDALLFSECRGGQYVKRFAGTPAARSKRDAVDIDAETVNDDFVQGTSQSTICT
jgi:hypothetical protein